MKSYFPVVVLFPALLLAACAQTPSNTATAQQPRTPAGSLELTLNDPWSASAHLTPDGKVLLASASHRDDYLKLWEITRDRKAREITQDNRTGFHPDGMRWHGKNDLFLCAEGTSEMQKWVFADNKLELKQRVTTIPAINVTPTDLDQDGLTDLVVSPYAGNSLTLLWGKADGAYTETKLATNKIPQYTRVVDWDKDGKPDIVWSDYHEGSIQIARNLGQRKFATSLLQDKSRGSPRQVDVGDIDGDGYPDMVIAQETGKAARILYNDRKGGVLAEKTEIPAPLYGFNSVAIMQDKDGPMLAMSEHGRIILAKPLQRNNPRGAWETRSLPAGQLPLDLQFFDLDRDGEMDLYFANAAGDTIQAHFGPLWEQAEAVK